MLSSIAGHLSYTASEYGRVCPEAQDGVLYGTKGQEDHSNQTHLCLWGAIKEARKHLVVMDGSGYRGETEWSGHKGRGTRGEPIL
jgi:hypothetical protein